MPGKKISFLDFCAKQFLSGQDKAEFQDWLGNEAYSLRYEGEWLQLFGEWWQSKAINEFRL